MYVHVYVCRLREVILVESQIDCYVSFPFSHVFSCSYYTRTVWNGRVERVHLSNVKTKT